MTMGFPEGGRNSSLFNVGVYFRKKNPDDWQEDLMKFNYEHVGEPLPATEINGLIKAVLKKDYAYTCKQPPICNYCERSKCIKRDYGIGGIGGGATIEIDAITKYETENRSSVRWYIEVQGERIEVTTQQLLDQRQLQKLCVEKLNKCPSTMPAAKWETRVNELLTTVEVIQDPDDASPQGQFEKILDSFLTGKVQARQKDEIMNGKPCIQDPDDASPQGQFEKILDSFLTGKVQARQKDEIMNGKPWHDSDENKVYFRSEDLFIFLESRRFRYPSQHQVWSWLRTLEGDRKTFRIKSKPVKVWSVPAPEFYDDEELDVPSTVVEDF